MTDWQRNFLQKLEAAKKQWLHKFEYFAAEVVDPVFLAFDEFTSNHGFQVSQPPCDPGHRIYKFGVTENGYSLITFRMHGLEEVEVCSEVFVPGLGGREPAVKRIALCDATDAWVEAQFQSCLDCLVTLFGQAGVSSSTEAEDLVTA